MAQARYGQLQQQKPGVRLAPIAITLLALLALEIGTFLPLPGINLAYVTQQGGSLPFQSGLLARISVLALGMVPWFSALTIVELVRLLLPRSWLKGVSHAQPFSQLVIWLSLTFALMQGYGVTSALMEIPEMVAQPGASFIAIGTASLVGRQRIRHCARAADHTQGPRATASGLCWQRRCWCKCRNTGG